MKERATAKLHAELARVNLRRARWYVLALFVAHLALLGIDVSRLVSGELANDVGYRYLFYAHAVLTFGLGLYLAVPSLRAPDETRPPSRFQRSGFSLLLFFLLYLAAGVSTIDQLIHGQITVYIIGALAIAVGAYLRPRLALVLFGTAHAGFVLGMILLQSDGDLLVANLINGTLVAVLAVIVSRTLFSQFRRNHEHLSVIEEQRRTLQRLATEDSLTGLPNRRSILASLEQEFARSKRYGGGFAVALADLDHFKRINDRHSHAAGDAALQAATEAFRSCLRRSDHVGRYGGEEFLFIFPECELREATRACEKIREVLETYDWHEIARGLAVTTSIGVAESHGKGSVAELIHEADTELYAAKRSGRNRVCPAISH